MCGGVCLAIIGGALAVSGAVAAGVDHAIKSGNFVAGLEVTGFSMIAAGAGLLQPVLQVLVPDRFGKFYAGRWAIAQIPVAGSAYGSFRAFDSGNYGSAFVGAASAVYQAFGVYRAVREASGPASLATKREYYVVPLSSEEEPPLLFRHIRGAAGVDAATRVAPAGTKVTFTNRYGFRHGDFQGSSGTFEAYLGALADGATGVAGHYTPPSDGIFGLFSSPGRIEIFAQATFEGTFGIALPMGEGLIHTFSGSEFAQFIGFHEGGHALGFVGHFGEVTSNEFALGQMGLR